MRREILGVIAGILFLCWAAGVQATPIPFDQVEYEIEVTAGNLSDSQQAIFTQDITLIVEENDNRALASITYNPGTQMYALAAEAKNQAEATIVSSFKFNVPYQKITIKYNYDFQAFNEGYGHLLVTLNNNNIPTIIQDEQMIFPTSGNIDMVFSILPSMDYTLNFNLQLLSTFDQDLQLTVSQLSVALAPLPGSVLLTATGLAAILAAGRKSGRR